MEFMIVITIRLWLTQNVTNAEVSVAHVLLLEAWGRGLGSWAQPGLLYSALEFQMLFVWVQKRNEYLLPAEDVVRPPRCGRWCGRTVWLRVTRSPTHTVSVTLDSSSVWWLSVVIVCVCACCCCILVSNCVALCVFAGISVTKKTHTCEYNRLLSSHSFHVHPSLPLAAFPWQCWKEYWSGESHKSKCL